MISAEEWRQVLDYDPDTGELTWKIRPSYNVFPGDKAGTLESQGYIVFQYKGKRHRAHRIAWIIFYGEIPPYGIDHRDGPRSNNRIRNLRPATQSQNNANMKLLTTNKVGLKGVRLKGGKFEAQIWKNRPIYLGRFDTKEAAHEAYWVKAQELFGEYARRA